MLTEREKWCFDLTGFLVLPQIVSPADIQRMLELGDAWHELRDEELPAPLCAYGNRKPTDARPIDNVVYMDEVFQRLVLNPELMRVILPLTRNCPQLLAASFTKNFQYNDDLPFHEGYDGGWRNPANDYQVADGVPFATFLNAAVSLVDVPEGAGGFVCVPGSHKSDFACPDDIGLYDSAPIVHNVSLKAGDCILFTEALRHGARRWTLETPRRTIFIRYSTSYASWTPGNAPDPQYRDLLSEEVAELMEMRGWQHRKSVVSRLLS